MLLWNTAAHIVEGALRGLLPHHARWAAPVLGAALRVVPEAVRAAEDVNATGKQRRRAVVGIVHEYLDAAFDDVPGWRDLGEARRDALLGALTEIVLFILHVTSKREPATATKGAQQARRELDASDSGLDDADELAQDGRRARRLALLRQGKPLAPRVRALLLDRGAVTDG